MSILKKTPTRLVQLQSKSSRAISVFKSTVANLASVNDEIIVELDAVELRLKALKTTKIALSLQAKENQSFVDKINHFLGVDDGDTAAVKGDA